MLYYKIFSEDKATLIGVASSADFRCFTDEGILLVCDERKAQYISVNNTLYHAEDLLLEPTDKIGKYKRVRIQLSTQEDVANYQKEKATAELEMIRKMDS